MKLNLDFALYKGKTRLREWWKVVKSHFTAVQDAVNELDSVDKELDNKISSEATARINADRTLDGKISSEAKARANADSALDGKISSEATARANADSALDGKVSSEATARADADRDLGERINDVSNIATGLDREIGDIKSDIQTALGEIDILTGADTVNGSVDKKVKDAITELASTVEAESQARTSADNNLSDRLTDEESERKRVDGKLFDNITDAAAAIAAETSAREAADTAFDERVTPLEAVAHTHDNKDVLDIITAGDVEHLRELTTQVTEEQLNAVYDFFAEITYARDRELQNIYAAMGCTVYDGGLFGAPIDGAELNGGLFGETEDGIVDCGDFEPFRCNCGGGGSTQTIDGGGYSDTSGTVIDGGSYSDVNGTVIDGGVYP